MAQRGGWPQPELYWKHGGTEKMNAECKMKNAKSNATNGDAFFTLHFAFCNFSVPPFLRVLRDFVIS
jgi:hypothetical protein